MLILDTLNVLHTVGVLPPDLAGLDVPALARLILRSRFAREKIVFACDGLPASDLPAAGPLILPEHGGTAIEVRYSGRGVTADDLIRRMIDVSTAPRRLTIVSSDHEIQRAARKRRCITLTSDAFLQQLADDADLPRPTTAPARKPAMPPLLSEEQVRKWMSVFKVDESLARRSSSAAAPEAPAAATSPDAVAGEPDQATETGRAEDADMPRPVLPTDLISEAEALWRRESRSAGAGGNESDSA